MKLLILKELKYTPLVLAISTSILGCKKHENKDDDNKINLVHFKNASTICSFFNSIIDESNSIIEPIASKENYEKYKKRLSSLKSLEDDDIHEKHNIISDIVSFLDQHDDSNEKLNKLKISFKNELDKIKEELKYRAKYYTQNFVNSIEKINTNKNLNPNLFTLNKNTKSIEFYDDFNKTSKTFTIQSNEDFINIEKFKEHFEYHNKNIAQENNLKQNESFSNLNFGLSHAYMIKFIIEALADENSDYIIRKSDSKLQKIMKAHAYVNIAQLSNDVAIDSSILLIKQIDNNFNFENIRNIGKKLSLGLNVANLFFNILEIKNAKTISERVDTEHRLATDLTSIGLGVIGEGIATLAGEAVAATFESLLAIPITGLTYGIDAYSNIIADETKQALNVANYFYDYENNHYLLADSKVFVPNSSKSVLSLAHKNFKNNIEKSDHLNIVISDIDLTNKDSIKIKYGSHYIYPTKGASTLEETQNYLNSKPFFDTTTLYISSFGESPSIIINKDQAIPFRKSFIPRNTKDELSIAKKLESSEIQILEKTKIILPIQPVSFIKYKYQITPYITYRTDKEIMSAYKIQQNGGFLFEYYIGMRGSADYAIFSLDHEYQKTDININLGEINKKFITPELPNEFKNFISYNFKSESEASHYVKIADGVNYSIESKGLDNWYFGVNATDIKLSKVNNNIIKINDISISFPKFIPKNLYVQDKLGRIYIISVSNCELHPFHPKNELDLSKEVDASIHNNPNQLDEFLEQHYINNKETNFKYLKIKNHPSAKLINNKRAPVFYKLENKELIHTDGIKGFNDLNNVEIYGEIKGNIIYYSKKEKTISYKNNMDKNYIIKNVKEIYKNGENVLVESSKNNHLFLEIRENGVYIVETDKQFTERNLQTTLNENFELDDIVTLTYRSWYSTLPIHYDYKNSGIIIGWFFKDIKKSYLLPTQSEKTVNRLVGYRSFENNSSTLFVYEKNNNRSDLFKITYSNNNFSSPEAIRLPDNDLIKDTKIYLNEPIIISKKGIIYKIDENFKPYIIGYNQNWLENFNDTNLNEIISNTKLKKDYLILLMNDQKIKIDLIQNKLFLYTKNTVPLHNSDPNSNNYYFYDLINDKLLHINKEFLNYNNFIIYAKNNETLVSLKYLKNDEFIISDNKSSIDLNNESKFNKNDFYLLNFLYNNFNFIDKDIKRGN